MIVKQILLLFSTIILAVTGLPHDLTYKEKYDNLESHSFAPVFDQNKAQSVLNTLRSKEKLNLKPCRRRFNSDSSLDSDQLIQTSSHVVVIPYESLDSNSMDSQKNYVLNKNKVQYFDDGDLNKAFLQDKSTENEQKSKSVSKAGKNVVNYIRSPKKNKVNVTLNYEPQNLSQQESVDISEEAKPIQSPFKVLKSQHVSVEDANDTLESLARRASPGYDSEHRESTAYYPYPSKNNHEKVNKTVPLLSHNPKNVRNPIIRGQNIDDSLSMQENDENYDAITNALDMAEEDMRSKKNSQNEKYNPKVFENIAKLLSIYEQKNEEQELPLKARLVINPVRNTLNAQSLKKYDVTLEDTDSIQDDQNSVKNNLSNLRSKVNAEQYPKTYEESYVNRNHVTNYLKSQSFKHNDNEESNSQESNLTKESEEYEMDLKSDENNLRNSHGKNKVKSVIISPKNYFNNQKDRDDTHEPNYSQSFLTLQKQLHLNSNSDSVQSYEYVNSEQRSEEDSNYFSESEQDLSLGVHEFNKSQLNDKNSNFSSSQSNNNLIVKVSPLIEDTRHLFNTELSKGQNLSQEVDENSLNYNIEDLSVSKIQKSNSRHQINSPVSKVTSSLKGRKLLLNDDDINQSSSQEERDSLQYSSSIHKSYDEENQSNLSDYQENKEKQVNGRYQHKVQVPEMKVKEKKYLVNDQVSNYITPNQNLIDQNLTQEVEENSQDYHSSPSNSRDQNYDTEDLSDSVENKFQRSNSRYQINSPVSKVTTSLKSGKQRLDDNSINLSSSQEEEDGPQYHSSHKFHDEDNIPNLSDYEKNEDKRVDRIYQYKVQIPEIRVKEKKRLVNDQIPNYKSLNQNLIDRNLTQEVEENNQNYHSLPHGSHQQEEIDDLSESSENKVQKSNSRHQKNSLVSKVTASLQGTKLLFNDDNINESSSQEQEDSLQYSSSSHKSHDEDNQSNLSDYQENEDKRISGRYQHKVQVPEIRVKKKKHLVNDQVSNHKSNQNLIDQNLTQEVEENSQDYHSSPSDSYQRNYDIEDLSESLENKVQKSNSRHQINSPVSKVTTSLKSRKQLLNDNSINLSSSQVGENSSQYRRSHKSQNEDNKSNLSDYEENEGKRVNGHYQNKIQAPEIRATEKKHLVNDKVSHDESLNQETKLNIGDSNENSSQFNDNSQNDNLSRSLESKNNNFNSRNQNSQIIASAKRYQKLKKEVEGRTFYRSNVPSNHAENNNNNLDLSKPQENVEKNLVARDQATLSIAKVMVKDKQHLINDELFSDQLSSQETEESQHYRSSPHKSQNHNNSQNDNLIESRENIYNSLESRQQDSQVAVAKNSNLKSNYEAKISPQYHITFADVLSTHYDNYLNTSEIQKSEGKSSDDGYTQKKSQTIQETAKDAISYNDVNEEGGNRENINDGYVINISADKSINGDRENFYSMNDNTPNVDNVDLSFDHNSRLRNSYLDNIKGNTCLDRLDLSTDYAQSNEALPNDELEQNEEIDLRTGNNEQLDEDESQNDDDGCIKDKIKLSKNELLNSASRRFLNNYLEEEHQDQEDEEENANKEDDTEETEATEEIDERAVEESEQQNSEPQNSLFDPSIGKGVREFSESRMLLSESFRLVCYACSTLSDPTCWAPDGKTTVKYCQRGYDSCIQRTYEGKDTLIMVRDCAISCEGETVPGLSLKYKTCEICQSDLCNSAYTALNSLNLMVMLGVITFVKYVF